MRFRLPFGGFRRELSSGMHQKTLIPIFLIFIRITGSKRVKKVGTFLAE